MPNIKDILSQIEQQVDEIVSLEQALVRIPSVNTGSMPTGNETAVCEYIRGWLEVDGIASEILGRVPERGNIIARLPGKSGKPGLLFLSHTDVVPVEDEDKWRFPPFSATVANGRIHGRGASDCKALLTSQLMAMRVLKRNKVILEDDLLLVSGADEEHGGRYGMAWLADHHPEKITAPMAINEGGGTPIKTAGTPIYLVGIGEKGRLQVDINIKGTSAHASVPWQGQNALYGLMQVLQRIERYQPDRDTSARLFDYLSVFAIEHKASPENIDEIIAEQRDTNLALSSILRAISRMTITPTMVHGGIKSNSVPEEIRLTCDVRTLPHQDEQYLQRKLEELLFDIPGVTFEIDYMAKPNESAFDTKFVKSIKTATELSLELDNINFAPFLSPGFTDSRYTRSLGVPTYGFVGAHPDDDPMLSNIHGTNESVGINSLIHGTKIMCSLAYNLLRTKRND